MPIEDLVGNTELLKRVLEHYKYRLDNFTTDEEIRPLISGPVRRYLTFGQLKSQVAEALNELTKDRNTANLKLPLYSNLVRSAARQYVRDLERIREKAGQELPDTKLRELELDIEAVKECLR
jgi:protoheme ferro-lyase